MHIPDSNITRSDAQNLINELNILIRQPSALQSPPCKNCLDSDRRHWRGEGGCSPECEHAAYALSEDPNRYPIEAHVLPLVFELTSIRLVKTCWSCEGHLDINGELWKLPQVSFYADKPIYSQLLCNYLARLYWRKKLHYPWEVVLTNFGRSWDISYTIKCDLSRIQKPDIKLMQEDLVEMANDLAKNIKMDARTLIRELISKRALMGTDEAP